MHLQFQRFIKLLLAPVTCIHAGNEKSNVLRIQDVSSRTVQRLPKHLRSMKVVFTVLKMH
jgi:hypothetical protein